MISKLKVLSIIFIFCFTWSCADKKNKISKIEESSMESQMSNAYKEGYLEFQKGDD